MKEAISHVLPAIYLHQSLTSPTPTDGPSQVQPRVYLGSLAHACHPPTLTTLGITHILSVCQTWNIFAEGLDAALRGVRVDAAAAERVREWRERFVTPEYRRIAIADRVCVDISSHFAETHDLLEGWLAQGDSVILVHCQAGISRSATILIAWLMARGEGMDLDEAHEIVKTARPVIRPNRGFWRALVRLQEELGRTRRVGRGAEEVARVTSE